VPIASAVGGAASATTSLPAQPSLAPPFKGGGSAAVASTNGMVSSEDPQATRIGVEVLAAGGNAIDAAVAVAYALSVTHHAAGGLGGGGFMIVHLASGETHAIDYREMAPAAATVKLNEKQLAAGAHGYLSAPVPGVVAGLNAARDRFGSKPLAELVAPAIALAKNGHSYGERQALVLSWFFKRVRRDPVLRALLGRGGKRERPLGRGQRLVQPDLAKTLLAIAAKGDDGFYKGEVARKIAKAMKRHGGLVTEKDLAAYRVKLREPLEVSYRGYTVHTMPPPSMGGIAVASILLGLAQAGLPGRADRQPGAAEALHRFIESARRAYADRRSVGADPEFVDDAVRALRKQLLDPSYYQTRTPPMDPTRATPSSALTPIHETSAAPESADTTHFSVVDAQGNAVACTTTLSAAFGAWVAVPGTGVLLSNAMGGFSPHGVNVLQPGKRMASSMSPTIVTSAGRVLAVVGSPGGDTIPGTVAQVLSNLIDHRMTIDEAIRHPRVHHQYLPDVVRTEKKNAPSDATMKALRSLGHSVEPSPVLLGDVNALVVVDGKAYGFADTRKGGLALGPTSREGAK
jgi:gamma-glutamyltranspeptidase/glutathione hydrolase